MVKLEEIMTPFKERYPLILSRGTVELWIFGSVFRRVKPDKEQWDLELVPIAIYSD